ncbi:Vitamin B12 transporter BtuB precursor [Pigmentiphaga humi]|uniref:Vitamin B12 transporter BtuB n=1 Tax=Pigmentiphaga humi TaxID=2478468 RepID=A0A3P4AW77_9BURK|nr:TonB-dependent receptor [Pigmentiphaga humi]VCU68273.1 Vitamin B12 transporter BtuB precursor [Pigmentiphaga humi]
MSSSLISRRLAGAAGALLCAAQAHAQAPAAATLAPVTVTAARVEQPLSSALGDVTVIDSDTLERAGQSSLAELLQRQYGVEIGSNGGPQTTTSVFVRGANSRHTLVLIDGVRVGSTTSGAMSLNGVDPSSLQRIEILRGAASSIYGADAIGGVINLITKRETDRPLAIGASIGAGSHDTYSANVTLDGSQGMWSYGLQYGRSKSRGQNTTWPDSFVYSADRDGYEQENASARLGLNWAAGHRVEASVYHSRINGQYDNGSPFDSHAVTRVQATTLSSVDRLTDAWTSTLRFGRTVDDYRDLASPGSASRARTRQDLFTWQNDLKLAAGQNLSLIAEHLREEVLASSLGGSYPDGRRTNSAGAIYRGDFGAHHVQANLRFDHNSQYGSRTSGGLNYAYDLAPGWQATAGAHTAFRAPTYNDLYGWGANPDLRPEKARNVEAGLRYDRNGTQASLVAYRNRISDLIVWVDDGTGNWTGTNTNVDKAILKGLTLSAAQQFGATSLRASADWQDPRDARTGEQLARRARGTLRLAADHRLGPWLLGAEWLATTPRVDYAGAVGRLGGYSLLNLTAAYDIDRHTQVQVRLNNAFNKRYELAGGFAPPGSTVFVSLNYRP